MLKRLVPLVLILGVGVPGAWAVSSETAASIQEDEPSGKIESEEEEDRQERGWDLYWDRGVHLASLWGRLKVKFGTLVQNDSAGYANSESADTIVGPISSGVEWRRVRLYGQGAFHGDFQFKFNYDFADSPHLNDAYLAYTGFAVNVKGGRFRAPLGLEGTTRSTDLTFMERSALTSAFLPSRNTGIMFDGDFPGKRIHFSVGVIKPEDELGVGQFDNAGVSGRFATAFNLKNRFLMHTGIDFYRRDIEETVSFQSRPESHFAPPFVDTGNFDTSKVNITVVEAAVARGPTSVQGEVAYNDVVSEDGGDPQFWALYVMGSHFLTGESRPYDLRRATFGRARPKREFRDGAGGQGALEIAFRYSHVDLQDERIQGGILDNVGIAFNWYLTYYSRVMTNVIRSKLEAAEPVWIFQVRLQVDL